MKFTHNWLLEHLETSAKPEEIAEKLTALGLELEEFTDLGKTYAPFLVAEIVEATAHPNADKLRVCKVNNGTEVLQIVCGAPNARAGIKVCLAPIGANIPNGNFAIKKSKIRDVESCGMLCSAEELNLGGDSEGIMELDASAIVGSKYADYAGLNDCVYEIAITPNRADCLGVRGIARDLAAAGIGILKKLEIRNQKSEIQSPISILQSSTYYIGRYFKNVSNAQSPAWLQSRLKSIGLTPISALVDITNYFTFNFGRPLHVYDADKLQGNLEVKVQRSKVKFNALNNKTYELEDELVIADEKGAVALAGVIGNVESAVDENTKNVFLEVAYFAPEDVMKSGRKHMIDSDARYRFERGIDAGFMEDAAALATQLILEICGGESSQLVTAGQKPAAPKEIEFDFNYIKTYGGVDVDFAKATQILQALGFNVASLRAQRSNPEIATAALQPRNDVVITPPSWRADVEGSADIVEEVLRVIGLENIPLTPIKYSTPIRITQNAIRTSLVNRGLNEVVTYSFESAKHNASGQKLLNPISEELAVMRCSIVPNLIEAAKRNNNRGFKNIGFFEIGPVFGANEQLVAAGIRAGKDTDRNVYGTVRSADCFDAKADLLAITGEYGEIREGNAPEYYHPGRSGGIYLGKNCLGVFGELHPAYIKKMDIAAPVVAFEAFLDNLPKTAKKFKKIEVSDLLPFNRDFAFMADEAFKAADLLAAIRKTSQLIQDVSVFDVFQGKNIEAGKKSIALTVTIAPKDKTLSDVEIEGISQAIIAAAAKLGAILRK